MNKKVAQHVNNDQKKHKIMIENNMVKIVDDVTDFGEEVISTVGPSLIDPAADFIKDHLPDGDQVLEFVGDALDFIGSIFGG